MIMSAAFQDIPKARIAAGMSAISGPTYGMNSIMPLMRARVKVLPRDISKITPTRVSHI